MKSVQQVEKERREFRFDPNRNSVHRSSLMVPELPDCATVVTFLNHFLLKREIRSVGCRVTAIDVNGGRIESQLLRIDEPRVYRIDLSAMFMARGAVNYMVEFFAAENLAVPFPAVMVNHIGRQSINTLHAYNRVLNDVFEADSQSAIAPPEASADIRIDGATDSFLVIGSGPHALSGDVEIELANDQGMHRAAVPISIPRLSNITISLREVFPQLTGGATGVLKVRQPQQASFFGRMIVGRRRGEAFSANHTYYDSSSAGEYWDNDAPSWGLYPYFPHLKNTVRFYPVMAPGRLSVSMVAKDSTGRDLKQIKLGDLISPSVEFLDCDIEPLLAQHGIAASAVSAILIETRPLGGNTPTRIAHQLVHSDGGLESSVVMGLKNPNTLQPAKAFSWGQLPVGGEVKSWLGVSRDPGGSTAAVLKLEFFSTTGLIARRELSLPPAAGCVIAAEDIVGDLAAAAAVDFVWFTVSSDTKDFMAYSVTRHRSGHCTGEHAF